MDDIQRLRSLADLMRNQAAAMGDRPEAREMVAMAKDYDEQADALARKRASKGF